MSWKVHGTDEVFAALRGLCSNSYRMYDPCEHRYYYGHDCDVYECAVEDAAQEYERLLRHCEKQRDELAAIKNPLGRLKEAFMDNVGTDTEHIEGSSKVRAGSSITDELRDFAGGLATLAAAREANAIADRIDAEHAKAVERARMDGMDATFGNGWVRLPVDADGVPIRLGDVMEADGDVFNVLSMELFYDGSWSIRNDVGNGFEYWELHHVKPDSWERIIEDAANFALDTQHTARRISLEPFVERCRRLAGERA